MFASFHSLDTIQNDTSVHALVAKLQSGRADPMADHFLILGVGMANLRALRRQQAVSLLGSQQQCNANSSMAMSKKTPLLCQSEEAWENLLMKDFKTAFGSKRRRGPSVHQAAKGELPQ